MSKIKTFDSSMVTWYIIEADKNQDWVRTYCADGDGILQVMVYTDRIELLDQSDVCLTWGVDTDMGEILEVAQAHLQTHYLEIYEDAMHYQNNCEQDLFRKLTAFVG
jgi:hypothetical protein